MKRRILSMILALCMLLAIAPVVTTEAAATSMVELKNSDAQLQVESEVVCGANITLVANAPLYRTPTATTVTDPLWDVFTFVITVSSPGYVELSNGTRRYYFSAIYTPTDERMTYYVAESSLSAIDVKHTYGDAESEHPHYSYCECGASKTNSDSTCSICNSLASGYCGGEGDGTNLTWTLTDDGTLTISGTGKMADYDWDSTPWADYKDSLKTLVINSGVTSIGEFAFCDCSGFTGGLTIPASVTSIGNSAFDNCSGFTGSLVIPNSVKSIGDSAFSGCRGFTGSLTISNSVTSIGKSVFNKCSGFTGKLTIPNSVTTIGGYAFGNCSGFTGDLVIPDSVTSIGNWAFSGCSGFDGELVIGDGVTTISSSAFAYCSGFSGKIVMGKSVTTIGSSAFNYFGGLSGNVYFKGNAPTVTGAADSGASFPANFTLYYIPGTTGWTDSDYYDADAGTWNGYKLETWDGTGESNVLASGYCGGEGDGTNLTWTLTDDGTLTISGTGAMANYSQSTSTESSTAPWIEYKTSLKTLVIEEGVTSVGRYAFNRCKELSGELVIPYGITSVGYAAFSGCSGFTGELVIPDSAVGIGDYAFSGCSGFTGELVIPDSITSIGNYAFSYCSGFSGDLIIPKGETLISCSVFAFCSGFDGELIIPDNISKIMIFAFSNCSSLSGDLIIPDSVEYIQSGAFQKCSSLSGNVYFEGDAPWVSAISASDPAFPEGTTLYYIPGTTGWTDSDYYDADAGTWNGYKLETWDGTGESNVLASGYCGGEGDGTNLTWTLTDDGILTISGTGAMADFGYEYDYENNEWIFTVPWTSYVDSLKTLVIESGVTTIGNNAFKDCSGFTGDLVIPDGVTTIGDSAFSNCSGFTGDLLIPDSVTYIGKNAFTRCEGFDGKLTISASVTSIEYAAFSECGFTGELVIPDGVTRIDGFAFSCLNSGFTGELVIPSSVTSIGRYAFQNCSGFTGELVIPSSVTSIGDSAFHSCSGFTGTLVIPSTVTEIGSAPFSGTSGITWIEVESANPNYISTGGILYDKYFATVIQAPGGLSGELNIPDSVTTIGERAFYFCKNLTGDLVIPDGVTSIENSAFNNCSGFTGSLVIPDGVTSIESLAFSYCSGFSGDLVIPSGVSSIGILAFNGCTGLSGDVYFEGNAPTVTAASASFPSFPTDFTLYYIPGTTGWTDSDYYDADAGTWNGYMLGIWDGSMVYSGTCGDNAYWSLDMSTGTLTISGEGEMDDYSSGVAPWYKYSEEITSLQIQDGITRIGNYAFMWCVSLVEVDMGNVTSIGKSAFNSCSSLITIDIGESVESIEYDAFAHCWNLKSVYIPASVSEIDTSFRECEALERFVVSENNSQFKTDEMGALLRNGTFDSGAGMHRPGYSLVIYPAGLEATEYVMSDGIYQIEKAAFSYCDLVTITVPVTVRYIEEDAFDYCEIDDTYYLGTETMWNTVKIDGDQDGLDKTNMHFLSSISGVCGDDAYWSLDLETGAMDISGTGPMHDYYGIYEIPWKYYEHCILDLTICDEITCVSGTAFSGCSNLTNVELGTGITTIGALAFAGCRNLNNIEIPNGVTVIGHQAFCFCGFKSITVPASVTTIGDEAFWYCSDLENVILSDGLTTLGTAMFWSCTSLKNIVIPDSITAIEGGVFSGCTGLESITIPVSVTSVGNSAFYQCDSLADVYYGGTETQWSGIDIVANGNDPLVNATIHYTEVREDEYFTVTFDLNGGDGTAPAAQRVLKGGYATEPETPERKGYTFEGWYANKECTGTEWFSAASNHKGEPVESNITLYAKWIDSKNVEYGKDTFSFENASEDFFEDPNGVTNKEITGDYYDVLIKDRGEAEEKRILKTMNTAWGGSCFGMSAVLPLVKAGSLDVEYFHSAADCLYDLPYPKTSSVVFNLINYYHLTQMSDRTCYARVNYDESNETPNNRAVIDALNESSYPVVLGFNILNSSGVRIGGHAVVAYGYEATETGYNVKIWDPNDKSTPNTLFISKDFTTSYFESEYDSGGWTSYIKYALTVESGDYDYRNIQQELQKLGRSSGAEAVALTEDETTGMLLLDTNYASFTIKASDGTEAVMENGTKISGDLEISDGMCLNEMGAELSLEFSITPNGDVEYTIVPSEAVSIVTDEALEEYSTVLYYSDDVDGFYAGITAADTGTLTFGMDGSLSSEFETETYQAVSLADNDAATPWVAANFEATTTGLTVASDGEKVSVSSLTDAEITANVEDIYNSVEFAAASATADAELTLLEDTGEAGKIIFADQEQDMGCALIFYSLGGTTIEAQTNIPVGTAAEEPEDPVREGFIFAGWYASPVYEEESKWDFATPLEEDTRIYAKWQQDENYLHTVTFRAEGNDDIIVVLRDGQSLSEDQMPAVPEKEGYTGRWEDVDLTNVTSDIVVNAIYTSAGVLGDVNGDGKVTAVDARWLLQYLSGARKFSDEQLLLADVNGDGKVTAVDARWMLQYLSGARDENYQAK